jgi:quinol monooxygenase YgiN
VTVLILERHPVDPRSAPEFDQLADEVLVQMRAAPGALWADAARSLDADPSYLVASEWRTEADADAWTSSPQALWFADAIDPLLRADVTRRRFSAS